MSKGFEIRLGDTVHCKERVSGQDLTGSFTFSHAEGALTSLFSYGDFIYIKPENPIYLLTEQLEVISLFDNFGGPPGKRWRVEPLETVFIQQMRSNIAIAGRDEWKHEDRIRRVGFSVPEARDVLRNRDSVLRLNMNRPDLEQDDVGEEDWLVLNLTATGQMIRLSYHAEYNLLGNEPTVITPRFEIEFDEPIELSAYRLSMQPVLSFLSFVMGVRVSPKDITISRISLHEFLEHIDRAEHIEDHRVLSLWDVDQIESDEVHLSRLPARALDNEDLISLGKSLVTWVNRSSHWFDAELLMMGCLSKRHEISGDRLLNATKWLEKIPTATPKKALTKAALDEIVDAAFSSAQALDQKIDRQRIKGALQKVGDEPRGAYLSRLVGLAWRGTRTPRPIDEFLDHLQLSQRLRGKAAHGLLDISEEQEFRKCVRATMALEALCFMLMAVDLPLSEDGKARLKSHSFISDYVDTL
jgi:hypothetical protein